MVINNSDINSPKCPKCGGKMVLRESKYGKFWGCFKYAFTHCKGSLPFKGYVNNTEAKKDTSDKDQSIDLLKNTDKNLNFSKYQLAIFDYVANNSGNLLINGVAGCGKSTTLIHIAKILPKNLNIIFLAFNKDITVDLSGRIPEWCRVKTFHSQGYSNIRKIYPKIRIDENKLFNIFKEYIIDHIDIEEELKNNRNVILRLVNLIKDSLLDTSMESLSYLVDRYSLTLNGDTHVILDAIDYLFYKSINDMSSVDFSDMLYLCATGKIPCEKLDVMLVDEFQDTNDCQFAFIINSLKPTGRLIGVGDRRQAIYAFRAANPENMDKAKIKFNCIELPLSICYRCPEAIIKLINEEFPDIVFEGKDNNSQGILDTIDTNKFVKIIKDKELVLCRNNAPLVKPAFSLLSQGRKVIIKGKEIGQVLITLMEKINKKFNTENLTDFLESLESYRKVESEKLDKLNQTRKLESLNDQLDCIVEFSDGVDNITDIINRIDSIFSDEKTDGIIFSTIHKAKGLESNVVYLLKPELLPSKNAKKDWELEQEYNLMYVAHTRSKEALYFVKEAVQ